MMSRFIVMVSRTTLWLTVWEDSVINMPKKLDRRVQRTQQALGTALVDLILEMGYDSITIKELTQRAEIGYATFFRHFKTKDDLLMYVLQSVLQDLGEMTSNDMSPYEQAEVMFQYIADNSRIYRVLVNIPRDSELVSAIYKVIETPIKQEFVARDEDRIPMDVAVNHIVTSILELIRWWLDNDLCYSVEQMATIQSELIIKATTIVAFDRIEETEHA